MWFVPSRTTTIPSTSCCVFFFYLMVLLPLLLRLVQQQHHHPKLVVGASFITSTRPYSYHGYYYYYYFARTSTTSSRTTTTTISSTFTATRWNSNTKSRCSFRRHFLTSTASTTSTTASMSLRKESTGEGFPENLEEQQESKTSTSMPTLYHHFTVCLVPPPDGGKKNSSEEEEVVWDTITEFRRQLRDPGFYRWPPHANLLYPFVDPYVPQQDANKKHREEPQQQLNETVVSLLQSACQKVEPFTVKLKQLGTFGGKQRGVLWMNPEADEIQLLFQHLIEAFPYCKGKNQQPFVPHITLSHFVDLEAAVAAKDQIERQMEGKSLSFVLNEIYILGRNGDDGQFQKVATVSLGKNNYVQRHIKGEGSDGMLSFQGMPACEEDWVREERMKLKKRRNKRSRR